MGTTQDRSWSVAHATGDVGDVVRGRRVVVVGGTAGLGRAIALAAAARGAEVTVVGRTQRGGDENRSEIKFVKADLSLMSEARRVARELPVEGVDVVVFTTGIFAAPQREVTGEGIERDMAVSYLSRLVMLRELAPKLGGGASKPRVFIMGFPGAGQQGVLGDLNSERGYKAMAVHMNTVAGNEMLVSDAAKRYPNALFFGLNPGLIKTDIRSNYLGEGSLMHRVVETLIGWFTPTPETYAERVLPTLFSPSLDAHNGAHFDGHGRPILPSKGITEAHVNAFIAESEALVAARAPA